MNLKGIFNNILNGTIDMRKVFLKWFLLGHLIIIGVFSICLIVPLAVYFKPLAYLMLICTYLTIFYLISLFLIGFIGLFKQKNSKGKLISVFLFFYSILAIFFFLVFFGSFFGSASIGQFVSNFINKILM